VVAVRTMMTGAKDHENERDAGDEHADDLDEVGRESFPASDPPASWSGPEEDAQAPLD